jgi:hypothetical protein
MNSYRILAVMLVLALGAALPVPAFADDAENVSQGGEPPAKETGSPPRSPLRLNTVDFQDTDANSGKLILAGVALPGRKLYLFLDDTRIATIMPDDSGKWILESEMKLEDGRHTLRADQYDDSTEMLAARAIVTIQRVKPGSGEAPAPKATSP